MATLVEGISYGLSSQGHFHENKSLIFVKLTDSAYRAIEDYLRNKNKTSQQPKIQIRGNGGQMSFPSSESSHGYAGFNFTLSSNSEIEGPQASFECIQQTGSKSLESLGALQYKMRIQAKDDVYEATRYRMAVAEENHKKNCTREIKPGGPGIGRKVKVKNPIPPVAGRRDNGAAAASLLKHNFSSKPSTNGFTSSPHHSMMNGNLAPGKAHTKPQGNNHAQKPGNPDIMKRPLRERLIHLLAVRPHKKPELYDKINREGLRDRDRTNLANVLKQVSCMKGNTYTLIRHVWNDVQEDWPFYTEQERQSMKRHKPQNLTPPGSSDGGSSGSGQSPTSTHPGSPPSTISSSSMKRPGYIDGADGLPTKRQRISHYRKPLDLVPVVGRLPDSSQHQRSTVADSSSHSDDFYQRNRDKGREVMKVIPRNREDTVPRNGYSAAGMNGNEDNDTSSAQGGYESGSVDTVATNRGVCEDLHDNRNSRWTNGVSSTTQQGSSPDSQLENGDKTVASSSGSGYPEYLLSYTSICDSEQRKRYKADFTADYKEYRDLHAEVESVSKRFAQLEERLRQEDKNSSAWREIKNQIVHEYQENKKDHKFQEHKSRFQYLHEKLSHIKRLVLEYDSAVASGGDRY